MAKTKTAGKAGVDSPELMTYSVRFSEAERELLGRAAAIKSWSPTNLIRQAALESAASVVNTSTQTAFKRLALTLSEQAARPRFYVVTAVDENSEDSGPFNYRVSEADLEALVGEGTSPNLRVVGVRPETPQLPREVIKEINKAAKYGGGEFLRSFVEYSEGFSAGDKIDDAKIVVSEDSE